MQGHQASGDFILPTHTLPRGTGSGFCRWPVLDRTYRHFPWRTQSSFHSGKVLSDKNLISIISIWRRIKSACAHFLSQKALHSEFWFPLTNNRHDPLLKESSSNWEETIIFLNTLKKITRENICFPYILATIMLRSHSFHLERQTLLVFSVKYNDSVFKHFVHGILQPRILEWVAIRFSRGSSWSRDQTPVSWTLAVSLLSEPPG